MQATARLLAALCGLSFVPVAQAYVPPSYYVIRMLARKHAGFEDARFRSKLTFYKKNNEVAYTLGETLVIPDTERALVRITDSSGNELARHARKLVSSHASDLERPVTYDLFFLKDGANVFEHFKQLGLPLKTEAALYSEKEGNLPYKPEATVALDRLDNKIAVVIGERAKKSDSAPGPSLWVEKDSFLPVKAIFPTSPEAGMASEPLEYRMSSFSMYKSFLYPRVVQIFRGGQLWAKIETQDVKSAGSFNVADAPSKIEPDGDLRDFVETYLKWVR